jgi:U3 small nucleolar RNA-associated protein 19
MSGTVGQAAVSVPVKRKRLENGDPSKKRRKSATDDDSEPKAQIEKLENEIFESKKHYNNIATLIELGQKQDEDAKTGLAAADALCRVFIRLLASGSLVKRRDASEKDLTVTKWLRDRLADYRGLLISMLRNSRLALNALMLSMALVKAEALHLDDRQEAVFPRYFFSDVVAAVFESLDELLREELLKKFIKQYDDIRFYTFEAIKYSFPYSHLSDQSLC